MAWSAAELAELGAALAAVKARGLAWHEVAREDFPLAAVAAKLVRVAHELEQGRGVVKLTGFPVADYGPADLEILWFGLARHLGRPLYQDCNGQLMREIRDEGADPGVDLAARHGSLAGGPQGGPDGGTFLSSKARTYSSGALRFHTDRCDVVGLLTLGQAASGGISRIASTAAVHNAILAHRPDLLEELYRPIWRSRLGEEAGGESAVYVLPVFGVEGGKLTSHYSRTYIEAAQLRPGTPPMTGAQWQALDLLATEAERLALEMRLVPGDMQFLNNHAVYHARTPFRDDPASGRVRRLYRVWLAMANSRALPADHAVLWRDVRAGALRGGIGQHGVPAG
jgi:hypothetical protein